MQRDRNTFANQQSGSDLRFQAGHRQTEFDRRQLKTNLSASVSGKDVTLNAHLSVPLETDVTIKGLQLSDLARLGEVTKGINSTISNLLERGLSGISDRLENHPILSSAPAKMLKNLVGQMSQQPEVKDAGKLQARQSTSLKTETQATALRSRPSGTSSSQSISPKFNKDTGHINQEGLDLVKGFEGFQPKAYQDPIGKWTIGYGHTADVHPGEKITPAQGESFLRQDMQMAENAVRRNIHTPLSSNQFSALTSLAYNVGPTGFKKSGVAKQVNAGNYQAAANSFGKIVHGHGPNGPVLPGLVRRRAAEKELFLKPDSSSHSGHDAIASGNKKTSATTAKHNSYTVQKGDTLSGIAQKELGNANRWHELRRADGTPFTEQEAKRIQPGTAIFMPGAKLADKQPQAKSAGASNLSQKLVDISKNYLGVRESGGDNRGAKVGEFQRSVPGGKSGDSWCMEFAQYCIQQVETDTGAKSKIVRSANVMNVWKNAQKHGMAQKSPEPGTLAIFQWEPRGRTHVGIVKSVDPDRKGFTTIEGNTSDPNNKSAPDGVFEKHRSMNGQVLGFVKPF
jgi:GH24 family phage-related lysozyme (muramidase)